MARGYWVGRVDVTDEDAYARYLELNRAAFARYGARFLVRAGRCETVEGTARARNVVIEFPSYEAALDCYRSADYGNARAAREGAGEVDLLIIEGYDGPQPG